MKKLDNLKEGEFYQIDSQYSNTGVVRLLIKGAIYCSVQCPQTRSVWMTMTNRLSEIKTDLI